VPPSNAGPAQAGAPPRVACLPVAPPEHDSQLAPADLPTWAPDASDPVAGRRPQRRHACRQPV